MRVEQPAAAMSPSRHPCALSRRARSATRPTGAAGPRGGRVQPSRDPRDPGIDRDAHPPLPGSRRAQGCRGLRAGYWPAPDFSALRRDTTRATGSPSPGATRIEDPGIGHTARKRHRGGDPPGDPSRRLAHVAASQRISEGLQLTLEPDVAIGAGRARRRVHAQGGLDRPARQVEAAAHHEAHRGAEAQVDVVNVEAPSRSRKLIVAGPR